MRVWMIQTAPRWAQFQQDGVLYGKWQHVDPYFLDAYRWMMSRMIARLGPPPPKAGSPVWVWRRWSGKERPRPDLRASGHLSGGVCGVRLELDIDPSDVLLSDFDLWHYPLNYWHLPESLEAGERFHAELACLGLNPYRTKPLPDSRYHAAIERSWDRIFDLAWTQKDFTHPNGEKSIQGVMWSISLDCVKRVDRFVARGTRTCEETSTFSSA